MTATSRDSLPDTLLPAFRRAAERVPAYRTLLGEAGVRSDGITDLASFRQLPILEKRMTFQRFAIEQLCVDGELGRLGSVLTSSGHSGVFAFGLTPAGAAADAAAWIDGLLDRLFEVRTKPTLLINCLPMGVKVPTEACTLAETSVRPDMVVALVKTFSRHHAQTILVGETAFIKHVLELGRRAQVDWKNFLVHVIVGEEPLAENARSYLEAQLGIDGRRPGSGVVFSSMGVAELGLNLFFEAPPHRTLIALRRALHRDRKLAKAIFGRDLPAVPSLFTYDPARIFVEFDGANRLIVSTLSTELRVPLFRYATGDKGAMVDLSETARPQLVAAGLDWDALAALPIVALYGRGEHVLAGEAAVFPEAVKEGLYHSHPLVQLTTANFRIRSDFDRALIRIQLSPGIEPTSTITDAFRDALAHYVAGEFTVRCEPYESFGSGMALDYERKFPYVGP